MPHKHDGYLVRSASIYTVHPVVTEHRMQVIEQGEEPPYELGPFLKFICECLGVALGLGITALVVMFVFWLLAALCRCQ